MPFVYIHVTIEQSKNRNTDLRTALWRGWGCFCCQISTGGRRRLGAGSTNQDGHQYKTKFFYLNFFFFCTLNPPIRSWWSSEGAGLGDLAFLRFSFFRQYKIYRGRNERNEEEEDTEGRRGLNYCFEGFSHLHESLVLSFILCLSLTRSLALLMFTQEVGGVGRKGEGLSAPCSANPGQF